MNQSDDFSEVTSSRAEYVNKTVARLWLKKLPQKSADGNEC